MGKSIEQLINDENYLKKEIYFWILIHQTKKLIMAQRFYEGIISFSKSEILCIFKTRKMAREKQKILRLKNIKAYIRKISKKDILNICF